MTRSRALVLSLLVALAAGCGSSSGGNKLTLAAYSTPKEAYADIIPAFQKTPAGRGISFDQSYGASGEQERAVEAGLPADVVALSLEPDVTKLYHGFVTNSVVVFAVRKGNPKGIKTWDDLLKPGVQVITPNPFSSGGARWNVMAAYGAQIEQGKTPAQALDYLTSLFKNVPVLDKSARESLQTFSAGKGDVLIAYENEAITAKAKGEKLDYVVPDQTILIQNPVAVVSKSNNKAKAQAFVDFLRTPAAQKIYVEKGYRSVLKSLADEKRFPTPPGLFEIGRLGGWSKVGDEFFDPAKGKVAQIFQKQGKSTAKE